MSKTDYREGKRMVVPNVKVLWAYLVKPDTKFEHKWKITMILPKSLGQELLEDKFNVKKNEDGDYFLEADRKCVTKTGTHLKPPVVVGLDGTTPFTLPVGNGSICNVKIYAKAYTAGSGGVKAYLDAVQVLEHKAPPAKVIEGFVDASEKEKEIEAVSPFEE